MGLTRLQRAGVLLLVLWLTADLAAFGFCSGECLSASASASIGAPDGSGAVQCRAAHHCFCCSSTVEVTCFELARTTEGTILAPSPEPKTADIPIRTTSPPPKF